MRHVIDASFCLEFVLHKHLYRSVETLLERIDHSAGDQNMLSEILHMLVEDEEAQALGVVSGRLYREEAEVYRLIESIGEKGATIAGKTVSKSYQVVQDIEQRRLFVTSPDTPGIDPELEAQFTDQDAAAILIGRNPAHIMSLGIKHHGSEDDLLVLLETIRASVGLKLRERNLDDQMRQAQAIQESLVPSVLPTIEGFDIAAISRPAEDVGGDVYDLQDVEPDVLGLMIADASGHGLPAALQARDVVIGLRMGQSEDEKITATIGRLNRVINQTSLASRFVSVFYGELEKSGNLTYVNGGHCPPLLITSMNNVFELKVCGPVLGPLPDAIYRRGYVTLQPDEILVLFTDGVTERHDPKEDETDDDIVEFGRELLAQVVIKHRDESAQEIAAEVMRQVLEFGNRSPLDDDVTVMIIKRASAEIHPPTVDLTPVSLVIS
ncbi:MAG: serine phosphatase RsbU (regulator of sigma subunit) [Candidatus Krumholzibacteriia bacterium]